MTVTAALAKFVCDTGFEQMPPAVIDAAKRGLLDTLGVAVAGSREPAAAALVRMLQRLGGDAGASAIGTALRTNAPQAALVNGVMAHALDYDDDIGAGYGHPSAVLVPAVLALGESLGCTGRDVLAAYVLGVEVWYQIASAMPRLHPLGWHPTGIFGALGAAAAAAKLLGLDPQRTAIALGLGGSQSAGLIQNLGTMTKPFHAGNAARAGIVSALLAAEGFSASEEVLEGGLGFAFALGRGCTVDVDRMAANLGAPYAIVRPGLNVKRYPCYYSAHKCIDAMLALARAHAIDPAGVESVRCCVPARVTKILFHTAPKTGLEAKFSMQFFMAAALVDRSLGLAQFVDAKLHDPAIRALMPRVRMSAHATVDGGDPPHDHPDTVEVTLRDGRTLHRSVALAQGHADHPLSRDELREKFMDCAQRAMSRDDAAWLAEAVMQIDHADDLQPLIHALHTLSAPSSRRV